ncbi:MAG: DinB family protein [Trueperaceae bacterium]
MNSAETSATPGIPLFRQQAKIIDSTVRANLDGISHQDSLIQPEPAGSCLNWVLGHLTHTYEIALPLVKQESVLVEGALKRYERGSPPVEEGTDAWHFQDLLNAWEEAAKRFDSGLQTLSRADLDESGDYFGSGSETTLARCLNFIHFHQAYHSGQLGVLRRMTGKRGAIR